MQLWESILIDWKYLCKFCNEFSSGSRFIPIVEKFLLVPYPIASNFRPALFPIFFLLLNFWRRADWSMAILGELFFPIPWHRQIWKWRELSRRARSRMEAQHKTRYAMGKKKKKEKRKRNKRRIRKRRRVSRERDDRAFWRWRYNNRIFHNSTLDFGMPAYKFCHFFSLFLSSHLLPRSRRFANFYNLSAADTARAITFERISRNGEMNTRAKERLRLSLRAN